MSVVKGIQLKKIRKSPGEPVEEAVLVKGLGLEGDINSGKVDRQLSLFDEQAKIVNYESKKDGFCISRFSANIFIKDIDMEKLSTESTLGVGESVIQITQVGKGCHKECPVFLREGPCDLSNKAAYAKVIKGGRIKIGDTIILNPK